MGPGGPFGASAKLNGNSEQSIMHEASMTADWFERLRERCKL